MFRITFAIVSAALLIAGCGIHQKNLAELENENAGAKTNVGFCTENQVYGQCGLIMDEPHDGIVEVVLQNGHIYAFEDDDPDWIVGDLVGIVFDDNGTENITDDIIVSRRNIGYVTDTEFENWIKF